eukprot:scaffold895_cov132-Skeletonema_menzelii.AAC.8
MDPPEEDFESEYELSNYTSSGDYDDFDQPYSTSNVNSNRNGHYRNQRKIVLSGADNHLDEAELEGLVMANNATSSRVGSKSKTAAPLYLHYTRQLRQKLTPVIAILSLAWTPQYRSTTCVALLFIVFLSSVILTSNEENAWHKSLLSHTSSKPKFVYKNTKYDPFASLNSNQRHDILKSIYGFWGFFDGGADDRPKEPYMTVENAGNPFLDLTESKFPEESWQADAVYANHFQDAGAKLVVRAKEAIFATYHGYGLKNVQATGEGDDNATWELEDVDKRLQERINMFIVNQQVDLGSIASAEALDDFASSWREKGGWTTSRSWDGLKRRLLHALMTNSPFNVVVTGSWQSMGYGGNHGHQSMAAAMEQMLGPLFEKLNVHLVVRAIGLPPLTGLSSQDENELMMGGRSTLIHSLGWSSIYGSDVDMVVWDDYNLEENGKSDETSKALFDLFARQALLAGDTSLPFLWGGDFDVLRNLHQNADVDVGQLGNAMAGVEETASQSAASGLEWAAQYLKCSSKTKRYCDGDAYKFDSHCWVDHGGNAPPTPQLDQIPVLPTAVGWRMHQIKGYTLSYNILAALDDAIDLWAEKTIFEGHPLADENWHMGDYITNVQDKVKALTESNAQHCFQLEEQMKLPKRLCKNRMKGRTEHTPRANPIQTSLRSVLSNSDVSVESDALWEGYLSDEAIIPSGEVNPIEIANLVKNPSNAKQRRLLRQRWLRQRLVRRADNNLIGRALLSNVKRSITKRKAAGEVKNQLQRRLDNIEPGDGWKVVHTFPGDKCDGSILSSGCGTLKSSECLLEGHQGSRGGVWGTESTGWLVMKAPGVESGFAALNLEVESTLPDSFVLEYAIENGETRTLSTLHKDQFVENLQIPVPGMSLLTVFDDEKKSNVDLVVSVRVKGCNDDCKFGVTHLYWA